MALHVELQKTLERFVEQHRLALATIRLDLPVVIAEVSAKWLPRFSDPADVHGNAFCPDVRVSIADEWAKNRNGVPGMTLSCKLGTGCGAVFSEIGGTEFRLRKFTSKHLDQAFDREVMLPPEEQRRIALAELEEAAQLNLFAEPQRVPSPAKSRDDDEDQYDGIYALWVCEDNETVTSLDLCAVRGIDHPHRAEILALTPFPPAEESPFYLPAAPPKTYLEHPDEDFGRYERRGEGTGDDQPDPGPA